MAAASAQHGSSGTTVHVVRQAGRQQGMQDTYAPPATSEQQSSLPRLTPNLLLKMALLCSIVRCCWGVCHAVLHSAAAQVRSCLVLQANSCCRQFLLGVWDAIYGLLLPRRAVSRLVLQTNCYWGCGIPATATHVSRYVRKYRFISQGQHQTCCSS